MDIKEKLLAAIGLNEANLKELEEGKIKVGDIINSFAEKKVKEAIDSGSELIAKDRTSNYVSTIVSMIKKMSKKGILKNVPEDTDILNTKVDELVYDAFNELRAELESKINSDDPKLKDLQEKVKELTNEVNEKQTAYSNLEVKHKELENSIPELTAKIEAENKKKLSLTTKLIELKKDGKILDKKITDKAILSNPKLTDITFKDDGVYDANGKLMQHRNGDNLLVNHTIDSLLLEIAKEEDVIIETKDQEERRRSEEFKEHKEKTTLLKGIGDGEVSEKIKNAFQKAIPVNN